MKRVARTALLAATVLAALPAVASASALIPLAPSSSDWGSDPIFATSPPSDSRVFVVERSGGIRVVETGVLQQTPYLTVPGVDTAGERGLLSMAFAPDFGTSGLFYVFASKSGTPDQTQIVEYRAAAGAVTVDPGTARVVMAIDLPGATNHDGGQLAFGHDGILHVSIGDSADSANSQLLGNPFGKI